MSGYSNIHKVWDCVDAKVEVDARADIGGVSIPFFMGEPLGTPLFVVKDRALFSRVSVGGAGLVGPVESTAMASLEGGAGGM